MSEANDQQFRSVAFGGFHKQDVLNYIETMVKEQAAKTDALQKTLAETERAKGALEQQAAAAVQAQTETEEKLAAATAALAAATEKLEKTTKALTEAEQQNGDMKKRLKKAEPDAEAYAAVKNRTAGIELEAHHRAQDVLDEAAAQATKARAELEQWIFKVQSGYDRLRTDVDATISHANGELGRVGKTLEGISEEFATHDSDLTDLLHAYREATFPKAPEPLPIDGE